MSISYLMLGRRRNLNAFASFMAATYGTSGTDSLLWSAYAGDLNGANSIESYNKAVPAQSVLASSSYPGEEKLSTAGDGTCDADNYTGANATLSNAVINELTITNTAVNGYATQGLIVTPGVRYVVTGECAGDGTAAPSINEAGIYPHTYTASTDWQTINYEFVDNFAALRFAVFGGGIGNFVKFRNLSIKPANPLNVPITGATPSTTGGAIKLRNSLTYDGINDYGNAYSAELNSIFDPTSFSVLAVCKVSGSGVWGDGTLDWVVALEADSNNWVYLFKSTLANTFRFEYKAGGVIRNVDNTSAPTSYFMVVMTVSSGSDEMKGYFNNTQTGSTKTGLGTWAGNLSSTKTVIGAITATPTLVWNGDIPYVALFDDVLTLTDVQTIYGKLGSP